MKKAILLSFFLTFYFSVQIIAQTATDGKTTQKTTENDVKKSVNPDSLFKTRIENKEYEVWLEINFYNNNVIVPGQGVLGALPGYMGAKKDGRTWLITDAEIIDRHTATLTFINDYGSEDLTAELSINPDGTYVLTQKEGSTIKFAFKNKWVKLPKRLTFIRPAK